MNNGRQITEYDQEHETRKALERAGVQPIQALAPVHETAGTAVAERARALIEARVLLAVRNPRSWDEVRVRLLHECERPGFARAARYRKPVGDGIEGPSIRFAEAAIRYMRNLAVETTVVYDDEAKQILRVSVTDLEANVPYEQDVVVTKTVERRKPPRGEGASFRTRVNSFGDTIFIVQATDDECLNKTNALVSKALRTQALRLLPGDILDECMATCIRVAAAEDARDPDAARKALASAFFSVGVSAGQLGEYLGHDLAQVTPAELQELRAIYSAIRDAETSWAEVMDAKSPSDEKKGAAKKVQAVLEKARARTGKGKAPPKGKGKAPPEDPPPESQRPDEDDGSVPEEDEPRQPGED